MLLYHGSNTVVENPDVSFSRTNLDFGQGFYLTTHFEQAKNWAIRKKRFEQGEPVVNVYNFELEILDEFCIKQFQTESEEWLEYVASNRKGLILENVYDAVFGPVADDRVFEAVTMYIDGLWDQNTTLQALKYYKLNDQSCLKSQGLVNNCLEFKEVQGLDGMKWK